MSAEVYANGNSVAGKATDGKVLAAFPDVCLTPPSPPAGPIPVPYPNTSFSKDAQNGSKSVLVGGKEVMLKDQSFYKTSPLGDEAATKSLGASVLTHVITGKTYFNAWSMDVQFEGQNVDRHVDLTTSNHASYPGGTPPLTNMEKKALKRIAKGKCPCCGGESHVKDESPPPKPMNMKEWYLATNTRNPLPTKPGKIAKYNAKMARLNTLLTKVTPEGRKNAGCTCDTLTPKGLKREIVPSPPCDVFFQKPADTTAAAARTEKIAEKYKASSAEWRTSVGAPAGSQGNHLTPKSAGGCPGNKDQPGNLQSHEHLCDVCKDIDKAFSEFQ